jgi:hypothetical protein
MLASHGLVASTYRNQDRWKDAAELDVQVMETTKRVLGAEHPSILERHKTTKLYRPFLDEEG